MYIWAVTFILAGSACIQSVIELFMLPPIPRKRALLGKLVGHQDFNALPHCQIVSRHVFFLFSFILHMVFMSFFSRHFFHLFISQCGIMFQDVWNCKLNNSKDCLDEKKNYLPDSGKTAKKMLFIGFRPQWDVFMCPYSIWLLMCQYDFCLNC